MDREIGARLRRIRESRGLSQRQLARQSEVANATISQIEAGKLNPTVSMLKKVLDGIPIGLGEFFGEAFEVQERIFFRAEELTEIADGGVSYRQVGAHLANRALRQARWPHFQSLPQSAPPTEARVPSQWAGPLVSTPNGTAPKSSQ